MRTTHSSRINRSGRFVTGLVALLLAGGLAVPKGAALAAKHPFEPLSKKELKKAADLAQAHVGVLPGVDGARLLFPLVVLAEPPKAEVLAWLDSGGPMPARKAHVEVMHYPTNELWVAQVNLDTNAVESAVLQAAGTQSALVTSEFVNADTVVHANPAWQAAIAARGLDPDLCYLDVWAPGDVPGAGTLSFGAGTRLIRVLTFYRGDQGKHVYSRPVEGLIVTVDMNAQTQIGGVMVQGKVVDVNDTGVRPVSSDTGESPTTRPPLKPLKTVEPQGANYTRSGPQDRSVSWQGWQFFIALHPREGIVLYDVRYMGRRMGYRLSLSEIYVPYGIGDENWDWRTAFDVGEYNLGLLSQVLEAGVDVPTNAQFIDARLASDTGGSVAYPNTIAVWEAHSGLAWTRTDPTSYARDSRAARTLTCYGNAWIGNYIYGFRWIFHMDGTLEVEVELTGTLLARGSVTRAGDLPIDLSAPLVGEAPIVPGSDDKGGDGFARVRGPNHQHFFSFRLDLDIDGTANSVARQDVVHVPPAMAGGFENVFQAMETTFAVEGFDDANPFAAREWEVRSESAHNDLDQHTGYSIHLHDFAVPYSDPSYPPLQRAAFAKHQFWYTVHDDGELYAAGDHPNQGTGTDGLTAFADGESLGDGADVVVWVTPAHTHIPRAGQYPVMPTETIGFKLIEHGFVARNPTLDLPN